MLSWKCITNETDLNFSIFCCAITVGGPSYSGAGFGD